MTTRPGSALRRRVVKRAGNRCEYCLIPQDLSAATHQVDHIIAEKHGGPTTIENLALCCIVCNLHKASDIASLDPESGRLVPLFNPRTHVWSEHFALAGVEIVGLTPEGRATSALLKFNSYERLVERAELIKARQFPT